MKKQIIYPAKTLAQAIYNLVFAQTRTEDYLYEHVNLDADTENHRRLINVKLDARNFLSFEEISAISTAVVRDGWRRRLAA